MKVRVTRNKAWRQEMMVKTGTNLPEKIEVEINPATLSEDTRKVIIEACGNYPEKLHGFFFTNVWNTTIPALKEGSQNELILDKNAEDVTPADIDALVAGIMVNWEKFKADIIQRGIETEEKKRLDAIEIANNVNKRIQEFLNNKTFSPGTINDTSVFIAGYKIENDHPAYETVRNEAISRRDAHEQEKKDKENKKKDTFSNFVNEYGDENQKARYALNLLPEEEILDKVRNKVFEPLNDLERYTKIMGKEIACDCGEYTDPNYEFDVDDAETATAGEFELVKYIQNRIPDSNIKLRRHIGFCFTCHERDDNDGEVTRNSILVTVNVSGWIFSREYGV